MISMLQSWEGKVEVNGTVYDSIHDITPAMFSGGNISIKLLPVQSQTHRDDGNKVTKAEGNTEYRITVKQYMTKPSEPGFDFMEKWNKNIPMPLRTMTGWIEKETRGMVYMHLHGVGEPVIRCMRCGKTLSAPISRHYGIGPECMNKLGIVADIEDVENIKKQLVNVLWEGWIIKSAITEQEEV